ncbi:uncharacterized protein si:ch211-221j21.3 [Centropristis striata]|uniref:uncharacterized protein si:ch211-221j21.3 n=1 Tax=Centropristis striata TaxID=184440 RepID=UPI0027DF0C15|nr:uncharacterized protein si:ch211-221j21.3 [Centropristis striata]
MQCVNVVKKRSLDGDVEPWSCRAKRVCLGVELQVTECPMETSHSFEVSNQQQEQQLQVGPVRSRTSLCCPRCLRGEPGHFSHITGH